MNSLAFLLLPILVFGPTQAQKVDVLVEAIDSRQYDTLLENCIKILEADATGTDMYLYDVINRTAVHYRAREASDHSYDWLFKQLLRTTYQSNERTSLKAKIESAYNQAEKEALLPRQITYSRVLALLSLRTNATSESTFWIENAHELYSTSNKNQDENWAFIMLERVQTFASIGQFRTARKILAETSRSYNFDDYSDHFKLYHQYMFEFVSSTEEMFKQETIGKAKKEVLRGEQKLMEKNTELMQRNMLVISVFVLFLATTLLALLAYKNGRKLQIKNNQIDLLMRELHHRVKNNLQVLSSLLGLQSLSLTDKNAQIVVDESKNRIRAMSMIHQKLYMDENLTTLEISAYLKELTSELIESFGLADRLKVVYQMEPVDTNIDTAISLGLVVNELVTNSLKHAYQNIDQPELNISANRIADKLRISVKDNGQGADSEFTDASFGQRLIDLLTKQINGNLSARYNAGYEVYLDVPLTY